MEDVVRMSKGICNETTVLGEESVWLRLLLSALARSPEDTYRTGNEGSMMNLDIAQQRLRQQHLTQQTVETPQALVEWFGAVQAQDFAAAKWALGLRLSNVTDDDLERAFASGAILRTHVMRPTWHLVSPADIGWLLTLTAPHVRSVNASYDRKVALDEATFKRTNVVLATALQGGKHLTRNELAAILEQAGIAEVHGQR